MAEQEFDLQPVASAVKGNFDLQPASKDYGPEVPDNSKTFVGPEDTRSSSRKFLDAHPNIEWLLTGSSPQQEAMLKKEGINSTLQGPGLMSIPGLQTVADKVKNTGINSGNWYGGFLGDIGSQILGLAEGGFDPRTAGIKTGMLSPAEESLSQNLSKLKVAAPEATIKDAIGPTAKLNRPVEVVNGTAQLKKLPNSEAVNTAYQATKDAEVAKNLEGVQAKLDSALSESTPSVSPMDIKSETGALRLRGKSAPEVEAIRSQLIKTVSSGGKLNLAELYKPFADKVSASQFSKIVDDILESGDLQRAYEGVRNRQSSIDTTPMQMRPSSLTDAIGNLKNAVTQHITARATQDAMVAEEKAARAGKLSRIEGEGLEGFSKKSQALKGEYSKVPMEPIKDAISQIDLDELMNAPEKAFTDQFQRYRAQNAIAKVFGITGDRTPLQPNEIKLLQQTFGNEMAEQLNQLHGGMALVADGEPQFQKLSELANLSKSIQASTDLSAPLRQGLPMLLRSEFYPSFAKMFKFAGSENSYKSMQNYLANEWPERELAKKSGLSISQIGTDAGPKEEHFLSGLPEKVPVLGKVYRGSERAYVGFIDKLRSDVFTSMINDLRKSGIQTESSIKLKNGKEILVPSKEAKAVARYVNVATGRGSLSMTLPESLGGKTVSAEKYGDLLNSVFYSPRFQASRIQLITDPVFQWQNLPKTVRKEYLKSLLAVGGFVTTANGLGYALGGKLTSDPRSSDFGKIVSGPRNMTRTDPGGGWLQYLTLAAQLATGQKTNPVTGETKNLGEGYRAQDRGDVLQSFARYKLAPLPQYARGMFTGKDALGREFDPTSEAAKLVIPLLVQDITDILKEDPSLASGAKTIPALFGVGLNTFEEFKKKSKDESVKKSNLFDSLTTR